MWQVECSGTLSRATTPRRSFTIFLNVRPRGLLPSRNGLAIRELFSVDATTRKIIIERLVRTRRSMMIFLVVASTENNSRIASPFLDGSRPRGRTFRNMVKDLRGVVALESVPLHSTCHKTNAHHILVLQHTVAISFEYFARVKKYSILRCFLAQYFVLLSPPRTCSPPYVNSLCS